MAQSGQFNTNPNGPLDMSAYISGLGDQFNKSWKNQDDQMQFAKDQFAKTSGVTDRVVDRAMDTSARFRNYSATDRDVYEQQYMPAMKEQLDFARGYNTPGRAAANRAGAVAQSNLTFDTVGDSLRRGLQSYGVDPSAGRFAGLDAALGAKKAMNAAAAGTKSDRDTEMLGQQYLANAIRTGQTLPGQSATEANVSMAAGNQGVNAGLAQGTAGMSWMGTPLQWNQQGNTMYNMWPGAANLQFQAGRQLNQDTFNDNLAMMKFDQGSSSGTGAALGAGFGALGSIGKMIPWGSMFGGGEAAGSPTGPGSIGGGGSTLGDTGSWVAKGGRIRRFARGGRVTDVNDQNELGLTPGEHAARQSLWNGFAEGGAVDDGEDMSDQYNTELTPEEEAEYQRWAQQNGRQKDTYDYDMRGAWKNGIRADPTGHFPDTYKKPNHPTFSEESQYHGAGGRMGGRWSYDETGNETLQPHRPGMRGGGTVPGYVKGGGIFGIGGASGQPWDEGGVQGMGDMGGDMGGMSGIIGFIPDAIGIGTEFAGGDEGETESPQTPMDPAANLWDAASGKPREKYDEAERRGNKIGRFAGRFGQFLTGGMGGDAWAEGGGRLGAGVGAATEGDWGGAFDDIVQGTPLTFFRSAEGGNIPDPTSGVSGQGGNMVPPGASPSGGQNTDDVPAMVSVDEFVIPKDVAKWFGEKYLQNMIEKARREMSTAQAQPEPMQIPQAIAMQPPSFRSEGARA